MTSPSQKTCAYCGTPPPLTREHLWPKALHARKKKENEETENYFWISKIDKTVESEPTIKDVCEKCNNTTLSDLDSYGCELFDSHFMHMPHRHETVDFKFDYHKLKRWLLKISFNFARANQSMDLIAYRHLLPYILGKDDTVGKSVQLFCALNYPEYLPDECKSEQLPNWPYLFWPNINRAGFLIFQVHGVGQKPLRAINLRSYAFFLAFYEPHQRRSDHVDFSQHFLEGYPEARLLRPSQPSVFLKCNGFGAWETVSQSRRKIVFGQDSQT